MSGKVSEEVTWSCSLKEVELFAYFGFLHLIAWPAWTGGPVFLSAECFRQSQWEVYEFSSWNVAEFTLSCVCGCVSHPLCTTGLICATAGGQGSGRGQGTVLPLSESAWPLYKREPQLWPR